MDEKINEFDSMVGTEGLQQAVKTFTQISKSKIINHASPQTRHILKDASGVVICNHPYIYEVPVLLTALPFHEKIYLIVNALLMHFGKNIDSRLIPVYVDHNLKNPFGKILVNLVRIIHREHRYSTGWEVSKNKVSVQLAIDKVNEGGLVMIFPNPGLVRTEKKWFQGVGYLLSDTTHRGAKVIFVHIKGSSLLDFLRFIPFIGYILPTFHVYTIIPYSVKEVLAISSDPDIITNHLESSYNKWVATL